ncbi:MAG: KOW domain-containing RNA-binding protein [Clostridia bacterium]|nr:KOW domain-containing RNA-binding protein [Clostridia bacterium]
MEIGTLVYSIAGHDKGQYFIVTQIDQDFCFLVNGKQRKLSNPKKKNPKHVRKTNMKFSLNDQNTDKEIRRFINVQRGYDRS